MSPNIREIKFRAWHPNAKECVYFNWKNPEQAISMGRLYSFHDLIVMQFTGLQDKNGKEIYEGDILFIDHEIYGSLTGFVLFNSGRFVFTRNEGNFPVCEWKNLEIIGNIYENPDLLVKS